MLIAQAPLRVSLFGGGSDLPSFLALDQGAVLSFAINRRVFIIGHPFTHRSGILFKYSQTEDVSKPSDLQHPIAKEVFGRYGINNMDIAVMSDVPAGTGLGSSSSFTVASLAFVAGMKSLDRSPSELAQEACEIEIHILKEPIGYQDQWASALGGVNVLEFDRNQVSVKPVPLTSEQLQALQDNIFLVPVGSPRSAGKMLKAQGQSIQENSRTHRLTNELVELVPLGHKALLNNMDDLGPLLHQGWMIKREIAKNISNPEVDSLFERGLQAGATGGKLLGAGGSGYLAFYVPNEKQAEFKSQIPQRLDFEISLIGAGVIHES
jgi:D-glycero-alpha-D-manno-heptose-7-phosphate kinase